MNNKRLDATLFVFGTLVSLTISMGVILYALDRQGVFRSDVLGWVLTSVTWLLIAMQIGMIVALVVNVFEKSTYKLV